MYTAITQMIVMMKIMTLQINTHFHRAFPLPSASLGARRMAEGGRGRPRPRPPEQDSQRVSSRSAAAYPPEGYKSSSAMAALSVPAILAEKTRARPTMPPS